MFRLGATSYVYAGDLVFNAERLAGQVRDIELILFRTDDGTSNFPEAATIARLNALRIAHDLTYTVHLPLDLEYKPAHEHRAIAWAKHVIDLTASLDPFAYVFHLEGSDAGSAAWTENRIRAVEQLLPCVNDPHQLTLENLENYPPEYLEPIFAALPIARALDVGHLWKAGSDPLVYLKTWLPDTRVVHLHGVTHNDGKWIDHLSLSVMPAERLEPVLAGLKVWPGVLTLEVFEDDFFTSYTALNAALARLSA